MMDCCNPRTLPDAFSSCIRSPQSGQSIPSTHFKWNQVSSSSINHQNCSSEAYICTAIRRLCIQIEWPTFWTDIWHLLPDIGLFSGTISISSHIRQCRIILLLQPITKLNLFIYNRTKITGWFYFRCFRSKICFCTFSTVSLNSPIICSTALNCCIAY